MRKPGRPAHPTAANAMRIICPCCQSDFPIEAGINDVAARNAVKLAFGLTPFGDLVLGYVQLFKPANRAMPIARLVKILEELLAMIKQGRINRSGRTWAAPMDAWKSAFEEMLERRDKLTLPLKNHSYLLTIIAGFADKTEGSQEKQQEARKQGGVTKRDEPKRKAAKMPQEVKAQLNEFLNKTIS